MVMCCQECSYLNLEVVADVATVEFRADQLEFPVKERFGVPVLVADEVQDLLIVGHSVHTWKTHREAQVNKRVISVEAIYLYLSMVLCTSYDEAQVR